MLSRLDLRGGDADLRAVLTSTAPDDADTAAALTSVREIIAEVRERGDDALRDLTERFDGCRIDEVTVPPAALSSALDALPPRFRSALEYTAGEITAYHEAQRTQDLRIVRDGVVLRELAVPVERVGLYVPGGRAAYPSTVLMTAIPARLAGVAELALCVPAGKDGLVPDATLAAAALAGVDEVFRVGGAQAIAAMAYGTASIRPVDIVVGPGNRYVALAKREVAGDVGIESFAGPSEVVVVADGTASPRLVAADLIAQAEHGPDGAAVLVTWSEALADAVDAALDELTTSSERRSELESTLAAVGRAVLVRDPDAAMDVVNMIAPEHLELMTAEPEVQLRRVRNAGAVFCGPWSPAAVGDYVAGVNHVLPTGRTARFASALRLDTFLKHIHVVELDEAALARVSPYVQAFAEMEHLEAHGRSVALRDARSGS